MRLVPTLLALAYSGTLIDPSAIQNKFSDKDWDESAKSSNFLPRLDLKTSSSEVCKSGEFAVNHYAIDASGVLDDIGVTPDVLLIAWRPKALDMSGEVIISSYAAQSPEFKAIQAKSDIKDSKCMAGVEFLAWEASRKKFVTIFLASKSARKESVSFRNLLHKAATLKAKKCQSEKYTWFCPTAVPCSTPFDLPSTEAIQEQVELFNNPPTNLIEKAPDAPSGGRDR